MELFNISVFTMLHLCTRFTNHASHHFNVQCPHQLTDPVSAARLAGPSKDFLFLLFFTAPLASEMYGSVFMKGKKKDIDNGTSELALTMLHASTKIPVPFFYFP